MIFKSVITELIALVSPKVHHTSYEQMEASLFYEVASVQLPKTARSWVRVSFNC